MNRNEVVIRIENSGILVWSPVLQCYFTAGRTLLEKLLTLWEKTKSADALLESIVGLPESNIVPVGGELSARVIDNRARSDRSLFTPLEYYFDYTNHCNLKCGGCYNKRFLNSADMPADAIVNIISEMALLGIMRLHLAGGEPTVDPQTLELYLGTAQKVNIATSMATNGILLTDEMCDKILSHNPIAVSVSVDGYDEHTNAVRRGCGNFTGAVGGVRNLICAKKRLGVKTEICLKPTYSTTVSHGYFEKMIGLALELGVDKIKFANPERSLNHEQGHYRSNVRDYYKNMDFLAKLSLEYSQKIAITQITNPVAGCCQVGIPGMKGCIGAQELIAINPDGRISPCLMNTTDLGNYFDYGDMYSFFTRATALDDYLRRIRNPACYDCSLYAYCRGGCQVRKIVEHGTITGKDTYCPIAAGQKPAVPVEKDDMLLKPVYVYHSL